MLNLDVRLVKEVDAVGAILFFANFSKAFVKSGKEKCKFIIDDGQFGSISIKEMKLLKLAEFLGIAIVQDNDEQSSLWGSTQQGSAAMVNLLPVGWYSRTGDSLDAILLIPEPSQAMPRKEIIEKTRYSLDEIFDALEGTGFIPEQLMLMFTEMVKNSVDHSGSRSAIGIHVSRVHQRDARLTFAVCDLGDGLVRTVRNFAKASLDPKDRGIAVHGGVTELYKWAFEHGNTTKPSNGTNHGMGMGIIRDVANTASADIYLLDAESVLHVSSLPDDNSHSMMRRATYPTARSHCFGYFGEIKINT